MNARAPPEDLAAIVSEINAAARERSRLGGLLDVLVNCGIFDDVIAFGLQNPRQKLVVFDTRGDRGIGDRWKVWPLRRLFDSMLLRRITHPDRTQSALAIPFDYGHERCIVLAVLQTWAYGPELEPFFAALLSFTVPRCAPAMALPESIPISPVEPSVVLFSLCPLLRAVVDDMLARRGWVPVVAQNFYELHAAAEDGRPDIVFFDLEHDNDATRTLMRMHAVLPAETKIVAFGSPECRSLESQALVDQVFEHDAAEPEVFTALKRFTRQLPALRKTRLRAMTSDFEMALRDSHTLAELSATGARYLAGVMSGWASLHLVSESGATYASEHPRFADPVLSSLPKAFLSERPVYQVRADERFYQEVSDDRRVVGALERLRPLSAASIPLRHEERPFGTIISVSRGVMVDSDAFAALEGLAGAVRRRFQEFADRPTAMAGFIFPAGGMWERVRHGGLEFAAYRARSSVIGWDYRAIRSDFAFLVAGDEIEFPSMRGFTATAGGLEDELAYFVETRTQRHIFLAACNPAASTLTYAAKGFPAPVLFDAPGPAGALSARGIVVAGKIELVPPAGLLIWDASLQDKLARTGIEMRSITETLENLRPPGVAIVATNSVRN